MIAGQQGQLRRMAQLFLAGLSRSAQNILTAFIQIWANKGRSILTTLGIIIAVTAIITVVSFVEGFGRYMTGMLRGYGTQYMVVWPDISWEQEVTGVGRVTMTERDIEAVRTECPDVARITPFLFTETQVAYRKGAIENIPTRGVTEEYQVIRN